LLEAQVSGKPAVFLLDTRSNVSFVDFRSTNLIQFKADKVRHKTLALAYPQELPDAPKPKPRQHLNKKLFAAEVSLLAAAKTADAINTRRLLDNGGWENNPVFGRHPSPAKQAGINLALFA